jgi:hypothetical protein
MKIYGGRRASNLVLKNYILRVVLVNKLLYVFGGHQASNPSIPNRDQGIMYKKQTRCPIRANMQKRSHD